MRHSLFTTVLWHDLFRFSRRGGRFEYWWGQVLCLLYLVLVAFLVGIVSGDEESYGIADLFIVAAIVQVFIAQISLMVRRLNDLGYSGFLVLLYFIPLIGVIFWFVIGIFPAEPVANKWGERPATWPLNIVPAPSQNRP